MKACIKHGLYQPGSPSIPRGRCPDCYREDNQRRARKQQAHGRTTAHWRNVKAQAKSLAGYRCQNCGAHEEPTPRGWLSVHLRPELQGNHRQATPQDCIVLCLSCHGTLDGPRASQTQKQPGPSSSDFQGGWVRGTQGPSCPEPVFRERKFLAGRRDEPRGGDRGGDRPGAIACRPSMSRATVES
jgi:hypothetical protein